MMKLNQGLNLNEAIDELKDKQKKSKFNESVEIIYRLNVDPKQGD